MIEKDHLGAWDLVGPDGKTPRPYTLRIQAVGSNLLKTKDTPKGKRKCVITFEGARKKFVSNTTNCETIESLYGADTDGWIGKLVTLYQADVRNPKGKGTIKGIRVSSKPPPERQQPDRVPEREVDQQVRDEQNEAFGREPGEEG
jgi:hypothetical protein